MKSLLTVFFVLILVSCGQNSNNQPASGDGPVTQADSLLQEVIDGHDVAMPKIKKLERLIKDSEKAIDSINKLPAHLKKQNEALKLKLEDVAKDLTNANNAMHTWMNGFKYDSLQNNEPERIKYLQHQKEQVNLMKDAVLNSISKAEGLLGVK